MTNSPILNRILKSNNGIGHMQVVFMDIVAYSKRSDVQQKKVIEQFITSFNQAIAATMALPKYVNIAAKSKKDFSKDRIVLPTGDGAALIFPFTDLPTLHLDFSIELLRIIAKLKRCPKAKVDGFCECHDSFFLRIGLSEGKLILYSGINSEYNVAGDAINMAARVMGLADKNQIFLTSDSYSALKKFERNSNSFQQYSDVKIKHDLTVNVYQYSDLKKRFLNSDKVEKLLGVNKLQTDNTSDNPTLKKDIIDKLNIHNNSVDDIRNEIAVAYTTKLKKSPSWAINLLKKSKTTYPINEISKELFITNENDLRNMGDNIKKVIREISQSPDFESKDCEIHICYANPFSDAYSLCIEHVIYDDFIRAKTEFRETTEKNLKRFFLLLHQL